MKAKVRARLALVHRAMGKIVAELPGAIMHVLFFGGLAAVAFGAWMMYRPLGPVVGGAFALWVSFLIAAEQK